MYNELGGDGMRIYLDVCCLNRPFDDQSQERVRLEAEAVTLIFNGMKQRGWQWLGSPAVMVEIQKTPDMARRQAMLLLAKQIDEHISLSGDVAERTRFLQGIGMGAFDAAHVASAEAGNVDVFLTTDDRLLRISKRLAGMVNVRVENPLVWIQEMMR